MKITKRYRSTVQMNSGLKNLHLIFVLLFSTMMFSSPSYAGWTAVSVSVDGDTIYLDFDRIKKNGGYVYSWRLTNYLEPDEWGDFSSLVYEKIDCKLSRVIRLSKNYYTQPDAKGKPSTIDNKPDKDWAYAAPRSVRETILKNACSR